jgi:hypothetical protein
MTDPDLCAASLRRGPGPRPDGEPALRAGFSKAARVIRGQLESRLVALRHQDGGDPPSQPRTDCFGAASGRPDPKSERSGASREGRAERREPGGVQGAPPIQ